MERENNLIESKARIINIPAHGTFIWKSDIREIINVNFTGWQLEVSLLMKKDEDFKAEYKNWIKNKKVPISIAKKIITSVFNAMDEKIDINYTKPK